MILSKQTVCDFAARDFVDLYKKLALFITVAESTFTLSIDSTKTNVIFSVSKHEASVNE